MLEETARLGRPFREVDGVDEGLLFHTVWLVHAKPSTCATVSGPTGRIVHWHPSRWWERSGRR